MTVRTVPCRYNGGPIQGPRQIIIHSVESPMTPGIGYSLMTGYWQSAGNQTSVHGIADPADFTYGVPENLQAWHVGGSCNQTALGYEHAGRAAFSAADWITPDGVKMLNNSARELAKVAARHGIPLRWLSIAQLAANEMGFATHNDCRLAGRDSTHTDPGPNFPYKLYLQLLQQWTSGAPVKPSGTPNPQAAAVQVGGAAPEDDDMQLFFTYSEVTPRADGTYGSRVFISDGVFFRHVKDMEELAFEIYRLQQLGRTAQYVSDTKYARTDVPAGDPHAAAQVVAAAKWVLDPHVGGRDITEFLPKV